MTPRAGVAFPIALLWGVAAAGPWAGNARAAPCPVPPPGSATRAQAEAAYRRAPSVEGLYDLARAACQEGDTAAAADLLRRYRHEVPAPDAGRRQQVEESWALRGPGVEMAVAVGKDGDFLVVDGHLRGTLPLGLPLWLPPGPHRLAVEPRRGGRLEIGCTLDERRRYYALLSGGGGLSCSTPLTVLVLGQGPSAAPLAGAAQEALQRDPVVLPLPAAPGGGGGCQDDACALAQAQAAQATYLLQVRQDRGPVGVGAVLWDVALEDQAGTWRKDCAGCDAAELVRLLRREVRSWVREGMNRRRGELQVRSQPAGAAVLVDGRRRGETPLQVQVFSGLRAVRVEKTGFRPQDRTLAVPPDGAAELPVDLAPQVVRTERRPRPRWRLISGGVAVGAGLLLAGLGISALAVAGSCWDPPPGGTGECNFLYDTNAVGGGLLGAGAAVGLAGALLLALPGERHQVIVLQPGGIGPGAGLRLAGSF